MQDGRRLIPSKQAHVMILDDMEEGDDVTIYPISITTTPTASASTAPSATTTPTTTSTSSTSHPSSEVGVMMMKQLYHAAQVYQKAKNLRGASTIYRLDSSSSSSSSPLLCWSSLIIISPIYLHTGKFSPWIPQIE